MKKNYSIRRDELVPPERDAELALFTCVLQSEITRRSLAALGIDLPPVFDLTHNSRGDDPPDLFALGLGWECTEFPPDQSAQRAVHEERGPQGMMVPGFAQTRGDIKKIREHADYLGVHLPFNTVQDNLAALEDAFLKRVIGGPKSKDVKGNDVLLLDQRQDHWPDDAEKAVRCALEKQQPRFIKLIFLVRFKPFETGDRAVVSHVIQAYPF